MIIKNSFIYMGAELISKAFPFFLLPIITRYLSPEEYGIYGIYQVIISFMTPFVGMNLQTNITRNFFKVSIEEMSKILSSILVILHINLVIALVSVYIVTLLFENPFGISNNMLYAIPIIIFAQFINTFNLTILRNEERALTYGTIQIVTTTISFGATIILLIILGYGWYSLVFGSLIAYLLMTTYSIFSLSKKYSLGFNFSSFKNIYSVSLPLVFHGLGGSIIFLSDRIFIQHMLGLKDVGLYTVANQFGMISMIVINAILTAINPWFYKKLAEKSNKAISVSYLLMIIFVFIGIVVYIVDLFVFPFMVDKKYEGSTIIIFWISMSFVIRGWYQLFFNVVLDAGKTSIFMYITFLAGILNLIFNYFLINLNGAVGAAQATLLAFAFMFVATYIYAKKISPLNFWSFQ